MRAFIERNIIILLFSFALILVVAFLIWMVFGYFEMQLAVDEALRVYIDMLREELGLTALK